MDRPIRRARPGSEHTAAEPTPDRRLAPGSEPPEFMAHRPLYPPLREGEGRTDGFPEDDVFARMIDRSPRRPPLRRWLVPVLGSVAALALVVVVASQVRTDPSPQSVASDTASAAGVECPAERVGDRIQGNGTGGIDSAPAVIFAFQHAYYVARSGDAVREYVTGDAAVAGAAAIQQGIDSIPPGTAYCVSMTPGAATGQYLVVVTEYRPDATAYTYNTQTVNTTRVGERTLISAIAPAS